MVEIDSAGDQGWNRASAIAVVLYALLSALRYHDVGTPRESIKLGS